jgi:VIT1/CCC1 family predicted Fe2+/Mn2+ transporter
MKFTHHHSATEASYLRNFVFGVEDSLVSTVGLLSGIVIAGAEKEAILVTGVVLIFVEAFSMAVGSFLSESSAESYIRTEAASVKESLLNGIIMFFSYFLSGFVPLFPYLMFTVADAFKYSIGFSLLALFVLGVTSSNITHSSLIRGGIRTVLIGGMAILIGIFAGQLVS